MSRTSRLTLAEALVLARARWQIELLFKLWKSHGALDTSRSRKPHHQLCELYAKLLALLGQHWLFLVSCWRFPDRSLVRAAALVRQFALLLAATFSSHSHFVIAIERLVTVLASGARIDRRRSRPGTWQLLLALDDTPAAPRSTPTAA